MSSINFTCDSCGREVLGCTFVNGMKFCAKCYQETFGASKDWQLLDKDKTIADLEAKLAEKERQYETLYKLFSEQHEIIDQNELECFEEVNRLLKEQKDFYIVEKVEYDKMKQGAKDIIDQLKQQLAKKEKLLKKYVATSCPIIQDKIELLENIKEIISFKPPMQTYEEIIKTFMFRIDEKIKEIKGE